MYREKYTPTAFFFPDGWTRFFVLNDRSYVVASEVGISRTIRFTPPLSSPFEGEERVRIASLRSQ
jgi:hypothetical protein